MMFETFFESVKPSIHSPFNCITASIHYVLIKRGFRCIGMNEELFTSGTIPSTIKSSELMPQKWDENPKEVSIIYQGHDSHWMLKVIHADDTALTHLMRNTDQQMTDLPLLYKEHVGTTYSQYDQAFVEVGELLKLIEVKLVDPLFYESGGGKKKKEQGTSTPPPSSSPPSSPHPSPYPTYPPFHPSSNPYNPHSNPFNPPILPCGRSDLDPLGHCHPPTGGMIFDPLGMSRPRRYGPQNIDPSHIPWGSVPPGARFDPLNPMSGPSGLFGPDPDEMPKPHFNDPFNF